MLAGLVQAPSRARAEPQSARRRRRAPSSSSPRWHEQGFITPAQLKAALGRAGQGRARRTAPARRTTSPTGSWTCSTISSARSRATSWSTTTIDPALQAAAERAVVDELERQGRRSTTSSQGALVAMRPDGAVRALVGGRDYAREPVQPRDDARAASRAPPSSRSSTSPRIERGLTPGHGAGRRAGHAQGLDAGELHARLPRRR